MSDQGLLDQINKRLTLNWLIQGASQHAGMTLHYLVRDELTAIEPTLLRMYDQFALIHLLQWWHGDAVMFFGWPPRFWKRAASQRSHPFFGHPLLSRHGGMLAESGRKRALARCREKGVTRYPILFSLKASYLFVRLQRMESAHRLRLIELARKAAALVWGISVDRLEAELTTNVTFGVLRTPKTFQGRILRLAAVAYGGVLQRGETVSVVAKAPTWQLLTKELVKGTAELICLHGLNQLDDQTYHRVMVAADKIEYEPWMLQTGGELWRRLLLLVPEGQPMSEVLMNLARLPAQSLEALMLAVIEEPQRARGLLQGLKLEDHTA